MSKGSDNADRIPRALSPRRRPSFTRGHGCNGNRPGEFPSLGVITIRPESLPSSGTVTLRGPSVLVTLVLWTAAEGIGSEIRVIVPGPSDSSHPAAAPADPVDR